MNTDLWELQIEVFKGMQPPMRPHASEILLLKDIADTLVATQQIPNLQVLLLGVTQEIVHLDWPKGTMLTAVDRSQFMIDLFWPGDVPNQRKVIVADWFEMPFQKNTFHLIVGDGVFNFMQYPGGYASFASVLSQLLVPKGILCIRIFNQLVPKEDTKDLLHALHLNERINYFEFRLRLATSLQENAETGLHVTKESLDRYLVDHGVSLTELYTKSGYTPPDIPPLPKDDNYRISYPTDEEFIESVSSSFLLKKKLTGNYPLAYRTPVFVLSPKSIG